MRPRRLPAHVDDDGFDAFVDAEYGRLLAMALALTGDRTVAVDSVDAVLAEVLRSWDPSDDAVAIMSRRLLVERTRARRSPTSADPALVQRPDADRVWRAVRMLQGDQAAILALRHVDGAATDAIARIVGMADGAVETAEALAEETLESMLGVHAPPAPSLLRSDPPGTDMSEWAAP